MRAPKITSCLLLSITALVISGCHAALSATPAVPPESVISTVPLAPSRVMSADQTPTASTTAPPVPRTTHWQVGATPLPRRADRYGEMRPTPPELINRKLPTKDLLPPPADGRYASTITSVPSEVLARSTWQTGCPIAAKDLNYLTMSFWGFDGKAHTGEMLVKASVATGVTQAFGKLFALKFPLEEMRITSVEELNAEPTGDGNNTNAFVCRPARGQTNWSAHALGLAIDVNPFCNPYTKGDIVLPELAGSYIDRSLGRPGMMLPNSPVVQAFASIGWQWGGDWTTPKDIMHFTATGH